MKDTNEKTVKDLCKITGVSRFTVLKAINEVFPNKVKNGKKTVLNGLEALLVIQKLNGICNESIELQKRMIYENEKEAVKFSNAKKPEVKKEREKETVKQNKVSALIFNMGETTAVESDSYDFDDDYITALSKALAEKSNTEKAKAKIDKVELHDKRLHAITLFLFDNKKSYHVTLSDCEKLAKGILEKLYSIK